MKKQIAITLNPAIHHCGKSQAKNLKMNFSEYVQYLILQDKVKSDKS